MGISVPQHVEFPAQSFIPTGPITQLYAIVLILSVAWLVWRGGRDLQNLCIAVLIGWIGARLTTEQYSIVPIYLLSICGGWLAYNVAQRGAALTIAICYGLKVLVYSVGVLTVVPAYLIFDLSMLLGIIQIASLWAFHYGGGKVLYEMDREPADSGFVSTILNFRGNRMRIHPVDSESMDKESRRMAISSKLVASKDSK